MKFELEQADIQAIAREVTAEVIKVLRPLQDGKGEADIIFTVETLAKYLDADPDWIYKRTHLKEIPYFKIGGLLRFRKKDIDRWLDSCKTPVVNPLSGPLKRVK